MNDSPFRRLVALLACVVPVFAGAAVVLAGGQLPNLDDKTCEFSSVASDVAFGTYSGAMKETTTPIRYRCGKRTTKIRIYLATATPRQMQGPAGNYLTYELYRREKAGAPLEVWGNTPGTEFFDKEDKKETVETVEIIGQIPASQNVAAGSYRDPLTVRMTWEASGLKELTSQAYVTANVAQSCTITTSDLAFGNYDPVVSNGPGAGRDLDAAGTLTVTCAAGTAPVIWISPGTGERILTGRGSLLYELFSDPARTMAWGSTEASGVRLPVSSGAAQIVTVYGRIPRAQYVTAGTYSQSLTVTVNF